MNEILFLKFLHLIGFVYWLGGDLGTFFAAGFVVRDELTVESRATALKIMLGCDQGPKTCMPLMFPLGLQLGQSMGLVALPAWALVFVWMVALVWSVNVQYLYFTQNRSAKENVARVDFGLRIAVVAVVSVYAVGVLMGDAWLGPSWFAWKMLIFAALVTCGLLIRVKLKPFVAAFGQLLSQGPSSEINTAMVNALRSVRPLVYLIWIGLLLNAALGIHLIRV
jgi:hypothetical protein